MDCVSVASGVWVLPCWFGFTGLKAPAGRWCGLPGRYFVPFVVTMEVIFTARLFATVSLPSDLPAFSEYKGLFMEIIIIIIFTYLIGCFSYFIYEFLDMLLLK